MRLVRAAVRVRLPTHAIAPCAAEDISEFARRHAVRIVGADVPRTDKGCVRRLPRRNREIDGERFEDVLIGARRVRIADVPALTSKEYYTRGCTALLDAMGDGIRHIKNVHKYARPEDRPARTMFIITTDGMENASTRYTADQVRAMVKKQEKEAGWEFILLGANIDAERVAGDIGIPAENAATFACDAAGVRENFASLSRMTCAFSHTGIIGAGWKTKISEHLAKRKSGRS